MKLLYLICNYCSLGLLYLLSVAPLRLLHLFGDIIGYLISYLPIERQRVTNINLQLCYAEYSPLARKKLARQHWQLFARSTLERAYLWLGSKKQIKDFVQIKSAINLLDGKPRLFVSMHLIGIEAGLIAISIYMQELGLKEPNTLYVRMKNSFFDTRIKKWRERFGSKMVLRQHNSRDLIRQIRRQQVVVISPDMDLGKQDSIFVPFFGIPTCTVTSVSRLARLSGAEVCPIVTTLNPDGKGYTCHIYQALEHFPTADLIEDTTRLNQFFEAQIRPRPQEYYWVHKRFKNRPDGHPRFY